MNFLFLSDPPYFKFSHTQNNNGVNPLIYLSPKNDEN
uniref:Uncharacterized protein n=1 Tax=Siphoviridae sp. ctHNg1 TaxID=2827828 RepID=A0A8S5TFQ1_9CAUD|nr:MAG TPA: hypothetical protein [Siphoviridae sp. ctHNg1]